MPAVLRPLARAFAGFALAFLAVTALAVTATHAQDPPLPPHQYFGNGDGDSAALIDGAPPPDGTVIVALDAAGAELARTTVIETHWLIQVGQDQAAEVSFAFLGCEGNVGPFPVEVGGFTAVTLSADGCEPTVDLDALAQLRADRDAFSSGAADDSPTPQPDAEPAGEQTDGGAALEPTTAAPSDISPVGGGGGGNDWIWIVVGIVFAGLLAAGFVWLRRMTEPPAAPPAG